MLKRAVKIVMLATIVQMLLLPSVAHAYNGQGAANYASNWAFSRNPNYNSFSSDCANFASQALHSGGGYSYMYKYQYQPYAWWAAWTGIGFIQSRSWTEANSLRNFLLQDYPGGWDWGIQCRGSSCQSANSNSAYYGDLLFYDWTSDGWYDHVAVEVNYWGRDECYLNWYGDLVAQHTTDRRNAMWTLWNYNSQRWSTTIDLIHVDSRNL